jgi:hypothetical protein
MSGKTVATVKEKGKVVGRTVAYADPLSPKRKASGAHRTSSKGGFQLGSSAVRALSKSLSK